MGADPETPDTSLIGGSSSGGESAPRVADIIEKLGVGPFLVKELLLGASIWLAAGSQLIIISGITLAISKEWGLEGWQRSSIVSALFVGIMFGNFASGPYSDIMGRRCVILISYATVVFFSVLSAFAPGFWSMCSLRILLGIAFGFAQPAWNTLCTEISPASWRMATSVASSTLFVVGEIYAAGLIWVDDPEMKHLHWAWLTICGTVPAAIMGLMCWLWLNESATWLALQGQTDKAKDVLKSIRWWNRKEQESVDFAPSPAVEVESFAAMRQQMSTAMGETLRFTTVALCFSCFILNFVYYGTFYSFPLVLGKVDMGYSPAVALIMGALWELPGYMAAVLCSMVCGRRVSTLIYLVCMVLSIHMFVEGAKEQKAGNKSQFYAFALHAGFAGMKCWINMGFCMVYQYASEIYPTSARTAGTAICFGFGRIGSMAAPFVFEGMMSATNNSWEHFFYCMGAGCALNAILVALLPYETSGMTLKDHIHEMGETDPLISCAPSSRKAL